MKSFQNHNFLAIFLTFLPFTSGAPKIDRPNNVATVEEQNSNSAASGLNLNPAQFFGPFFQKGGLLDITPPPPAPGVQNDAPKDAFQDKEANEKFDKVFGRVQSVMKQFANVFADEETNSGSTPKGPNKNDPRPLGPQADDPHRNTPIVSESGDSGVMVFSSGGDVKPFAPLDGQNRKVQGTTKIVPTREQPISERPGPPKPTTLSPANEFSQKLDDVTGLTKFLIELMREKGGFEEILNTVNNPGIRAGLFPSG